MADALFTSTQQKVLGTLFGHPRQSFFVTQIMDIAQTGRGAVQRELQRLEQSGLVTVTMRGTQKHYQANPDSPLYDEIRNIVRKTVGLAEPIRQAVSQLADKVDLAFIYGSVAKEHDTSASDIDLLLVSDQLLLEDVFAALAPAEEVLLRRINPTLYTRAEFNARQGTGDSFLTRVLSGPVIPLIGTIDAE